MVAGYMRAQRIFGGMILIAVLTDVAPRDVHGLHVEQAGALRLETKTALQTIPTLGRPANFRPYV